MLRLPRNDRLSRLPQNSAAADRLLLDGLLLVGHGTRDVEGTAQFFQLAAVLADQVAPRPVEPCLLELQPPTIPEAWRRLVDRGATQVVVCPLLLFTAGHARRDIPEAVSAAAATTPGVDFTFSRPLSRHPHVVELVVERLSESLRNPEPLAPSRTAIVTVGRGSYDPCARSDMQVLSAVVAKRVPAVRVETAFYAMAEPRVPAVLDELAADSAVEAIVVHPHLLFAGRLYEAIERQVQEAAARHPGVEFRTGRYLGPDRRIAAALKSRMACPQVIADCVQK